MQNKNSNLIQTALTAGGFLNYLSMSDALKTKHDCMKAQKISMQLLYAAGSPDTIPILRFAFELDQIVALADNPDEKGHIIGRAQYTNATVQYLLRYRNGNNVTVETWWSEDALRATE